MNNKVTSHIVKGVIISLVLIVISIIGHFTGAQNAKIAGYISYAVLALGIIWAVNSYGKQMNHQVTFGNLFAHGFKTSAVITVIFVVFTIAFFLILPEMKQEAIEMTRQELEDRNTPDDQIDMTMNLMEKSFLLLAIAGIVFFYLLVGVIASLIGAGVTKKDPPTPFANHV